MSFCTDLSIVRSYGGYKTVASLKCKRWSCPDCGPRRARDLRWRARRAEPTIFLTLTIRQGVYPTPEATARELVEGWRMLRQYLCRLLDRKSIPFLAVIEKHKSGWPHLHLLLRTKYIDRRLILEWWKARNNSFIIDIEQVRDKALVGAYVSKYVAKQPHQYEGCKRYWSSHDFDLSKPEPFVPADEGLYVQEIIAGNPWKIVRMALLDGATVNFDGDKWTVFHWTDRERRRWYD